MTDILDELRIIAKDGGRLSPADCALIARAADDLEHTSALLIRTQAAMIEAQSRQLAMAERMIEAQRYRPTFTYPPLWRVTWNYPPCP